MSKVYVGYVSGVHGLRGDLKIKCKFESPEKVFIVGNSILLNEESHEITACKFYKGVYLVTIDNIKDINKVEHYTGYDVYIDRSYIGDSYILDDLYDMTIICNGKTYGKVKEILNNNSYNILEIDYDKKYMIPLIDEYIINVKLDKKEIECKNIEGLIL